MDNLVIFFAVFTFILGICIGSFLNVLIYRLPRNESINFPASHCPNCDHKLNFYHNVPLFSWLFLGGKCAFCKKRISLIYPVIELVSGILFLIYFFKECGEILSVETLLYALFLGLCFIMLLALSVIDIRYKALVAIYLAALFTLPVYALVRKKSYELAFVPFLSLGLLITYAFKEQILEILRFIYE